MGTAEHGGVISTVLYVGIGVTGMAPCSALNVSDPISKMLIICTDAGAAMHASYGRGQTSKTPQDLWSRDLARV
jgi:hypothetical protein